MLTSADPLDAVGPFQLDLGAGAIGLVRSWATNPMSLNGFIVRRASGLGVAAFRAGVCRFRIVYHTATSTRLIVDSPVTTDLFIHTPLFPAATGADTTLILGGFYAPVVAFHAPIDSFTPGFSLDEARVVFRVRPDSPTFPDSIFVTVEGRGVQNSWVDHVPQPRGGLSGPRRVRHAPHRADSRRARARLVFGVRGQSRNRSSNRRVLPGQRDLALFARVVQASRVPDLHDQPASGEVLT
jgi:hypothetical protein